MVSMTKQQLMHETRENQEAPDYVHLLPVELLFFFFFER